METIITPDLKMKLDALVAKYETKRASLLEVLHLVQEHHGYVSILAEEAVANYLGIAPIDVHEVVTFYTLYYRKPKAKTRFNVCRTLSCSLAGSRDVVKHLERKLGVKSGDKNPGGSCSIQEVECLGACEIAPMLQLNDDEFFGNLTKEKLDALIKDYAAASAEPKPEKIKQ